MLGNLRNAGPLLKDGEVSRPVRVRAAVEVHVWLSTMSAAEVGAVLARVLASEGSGKAGAGASAPGPDETPPRASEGERLALALGTVPAMLTPYQRRVIDAMRGGSTLTRDGPRSPWRLARIDGTVSTVRGDSIQGLIDRRVLREV